ncbi:MAG: transporter substrate-binding domain-containing protein [Verrucomicrobiaceae bacterium]|nr:transporter substrate-binding domain-containing protein [Verrucomicrobiaceae bacterium]
MTLTRTLSTIVCFTFAFSCCFGQSASAPTTKIRVATRNLEPFSFDKDGRRVGFAAELWDALARESNIEYDIKVVDSAQEIIDAVQNKTADVGVGAISVTASREEVIDFSQPFYESGLQVLVSNEGGSYFDSLVAMIRNLFNLELIGSFLLLILAMLVVSHLVWKFEHKVNEDQWPREYKSGLWESFWWTISTLLVGGADNKGPVGVGGRIIALVWMLLSIVLVSLLTASFTTTLTINTLRGDINGPGDLPGRRVATIKGSTAEIWLNNRAAKVTALQDVSACIAALRSRKVDAVVYDAPILQYESAKLGDEKLHMVGSMFERQNYAFALQQGSELREKLNQGLLKLHESGVNVELRQKYFGETE